MKTINTQYLTARQAADATREKLFDECADAVREGHTPDELAQVTAFTAVTIRKALRERDVAPLRSGPKSRKTTPPE